MPIAIKLPESQGAKPETPVTARPKKRKAKKPKAARKPGKLPKRK
jgi:hypothetical protein